MKMLSAYECSPRRGRRHAALVSPAYAGMDPDYIRLEKAKESFPRIHDVLIKAFHGESPWAWCPIDGAFTLSSKRRFPFLSRDHFQIKSKLTHFRIFLRDLFKSLTKRHDDELICVVLFRVP